MALAINKKIKIKTQLNLTTLEDTKHMPSPRDGNKFGCY